MEAEAPTAVRETDRPAIARVLIVDDEEVIADLAAEVLTDAGFQCAVAHRGDEALALLAQGEFDVLFTDVAMPGGMDGIALAERCLQIRPHIEVIVTSGYYTAQWLNECRFDSLRKPYRMTNLIDAITIKAARAELRSGQR